MLKKIWNIAEYNKNRAFDLAARLAIPELAASVLCCRGIDTEQKARDFLSADICGLHDPFLLNDMDRAVCEIRRALDSNEKIAVYGDYDVDGMTSVSTLMLYLKSLGADCEYYIPDRLTEGYGLNTAALCQLRERGVSLVITVDTGVTAIEEAEYAKQIGLRLIITDHHECLDSLPDAVAVVNPMRRDSTYPFKSLAGVGVAFKLICALDGVQNTARLLDLYSDLICVGTIADVMPLTGENRIIVTHGLKNIADSNNMGLKMLINQISSTSKQITSSSISYTVAPRINAAGRMGCAEKAIELFLSDTQEAACQTAEFLCEQNRIRQQTEGEIFDDICRRLAHSFVPKRDKVIVMWGENWHNGVIGIVASKIAEKYSVPTLLISLSGNEGKGSGRSVKGFNLYDAVQACSHLLRRFGGHELAVGITIDAANLEAFRSAVIDYVDKVSPSEITASVDIDREIASDELTVRSVSGLSCLEPFGMDNKAPVFCMKNVKIREIIPLKNDRHLRLSVEKDGSVFTAFIFGASLNSCPVIEGESADIAFTADINEFRGRQSVRLVICDIRRASDLFLSDEQDLSLYAKFKSGANLTSAEAENLIPMRREFVNVFRYIKSNSENDMLCSECSVLYRRILRENRTDFTISRMRICLDVFNEFNIFTVSDDDGMLKIKLNQVSGKADINGSHILASIKGSVN